MWYRLDKDFPKGPKMFYSKLAAHTLTFANPSINPLIYAFSNENFKLSLSYIFPVCCKRRPSASNQVVYMKSNFSETINLLVIKEQVNYS